MVGELATGLVGDLINTGFKRGVSVIFQKIARLEKVDLSSKGVISKNPLVVEAIRDFETVIGTYQGRFTVTLDAFFKELSQTGILDSMVENALITRVSEPTEQLFRQLYSKFFESDADVHALYQSMIAAFETTLRELSKDHVLFALAQASQKDLGARLDRVDQALVGLINGINSGLNLTKEELHASTLRIARGLQLSYKTVRVETNRGPREVEINRIYVPPKLSYRDGGVNGRRLETLLRAARRASTSSTDHQIRASYFHSGHLGTLNYGELTDTFRRVVVLGDPGGGKSTLCQKFCYDMAKNCALQMQFKEKSFLDSGSYRLPIRIILRKFEQARATDPQLTIFLYMVRDLVNIAGGELEEVSRTIRELLARGRIALAFDGLDEILDTSMRQDYVDLVAAFCNQHPLCPVLVTSRFVGYDDARLPDEFEEIILEKFDDSEVEAYLIKFMRVVAGKTIAESQVAATAFLSQTVNTAKDLRRNPLMLGLMGWLFIASGDVPSNRPEIYKECSILMFERWDQRRGIIADAMSDFDRSQLFIKLASDIYGKPKYAGGVTKDWLESSLRESFTELYENKARAFKAAKEFVAFITGRAWVMSEVGDSVFSFTHQTFLEYFFARYLDDKYDSVSSLLVLLKQRIIRSEWNEVAHLALQLKTHRSLRKQEEALGILQRYAREARSAKSLNAILGFTSRSLEYLSPPESKITSFVDEAYAISIERGRLGDTTSLSFIAVAANSARERKDFLDRCICNKLASDIFSTDHQTRELIVRVINNQLIRYVERESDSAASLFLPLRISKEIRDRVSDKISEKAGDSRFYSGLNWQWYGRVAPDALERFGLSLIFNHPHLGSIGDLDGLTSLAVTASGLYGEPEKRSIVSPDAARRVLAMIAHLAPVLFPMDRQPFLINHFTAFPPPHVWTEIIASLDGVEGAATGVVLARRIVDALTVRKHRQSPGAENRTSAVVRNRDRTELQVASKDVGEGSIAVETLTRLIARTLPLFHPSDRQSMLNLQQVGVAAS